MSEVCAGEHASGAIRGESGVSASLGAGDWLTFAAAPTFAAMAALESASGGSNRLCMAAQDAWSLSGMVAMYLLMSAFHSTPWLKLIARRRGSARRIRAETSQDIPRAARSGAPLRNVEQSVSGGVADGVGFEPTAASPLLRFSRPAP
jgi:hypothetical protein